MKKSRVYEKTKRWLRKTYPLPFPCRVLLRPQKAMKAHKAVGIFFWMDDRAIIWISDTGHQVHMSECLIEEWVHAMRQATPLGVDYDGETHDAAFWALYGEVTTKWRNAVLP